MNYQIRKEVLPTYFQIGYYALDHGLSLGTPEYLYPASISALHYHHCFELGICLSGKGETHIENRIYHFKRGDMQYITPNTPHLSQAYEGEECKWIWTFIDPKIMTLNPEFQFLLEPSFEGFNGVFEPEEYPRLAKRIQNLMDRSVKDQLSDLDHFLAVGQILIEAARIGNIDKTLQNKLSIPEQIKPALVYIRENYSSPMMMSAEQIAKSCGLSVSHFRALFKSSIGITLPQYINQTKLAAANHLLETTQKTIAQVATESGFNEISYFNRVFQQVYGMTPKEMRSHLQRIR